MAARERRPARVDRPRRRRLRRSHLTVDRHRRGATAPPPGTRAHRGRHRPRARDHHRPAAGLPLELIPPVPLPRSPGPDLLRVPGRLAAAVRAAAASCAGTRRTSRWASAATSPPPSTWRPAGSASPILVHEQNALPGLANRSRPASPRTSSLVPRHPARPRHARRAAAAAGDRRPRPGRRASRGPRRVRPRPGPPDPAGQRGFAGRGEHQRGRPGCGGRPAPRRRQRPARARRQEPPAHRRPADRRATGATYVPVAYVDAMERAYAAADLMLGRCGAGTVETAAVGLPSVFVPYPPATGGRRTTPAAVVSVRGGLLLGDADCTPDWVAGEVPALLGDPSGRPRCAASWPASRGASGYGPGPARRPSPGASRARSGGGGL